MTAPTDAASPETIPAVAIIGIACRFPGATGPEAFWQMLERGDDGLRRVAPGPGADADLRPVCFSLDDRYCSDAAFFGIPPAQAALMDPQHRVFLECAWHALEDAGHGERGQDARTGLYAACGYNDYALRHVGPREFGAGATEAFAAMIGNDKDYLASRAAHLLNLTGPTVMCQSACSSGLLCVHQAVQALLSHEVDTALAGAASVSVALEDGYLPEPGGVMSPAARIAPLSADADGIVGGNGAAVVVLKRLADARADGDHVHATILGSAANNDGAARAGFTAPGVDGQRRVLREALDLSGLAPDDIGYIEAHGTGTPLGDPIEMQAIHDIYGPGRTPAVVGSVKGNTGHLNAAAGLAGLIKVVGALRRQTVPPTRNLSAPNPALGLDGSRFSLDPAALDGRPLQAAAVSSFGFGGTNVHMVLAPAPAADPRAGDAGGLAILPLSAHTPAALQAQREALARRLDSTDAALADIAGTLRDGRARLPRRCAVLASDPRQAADNLRRGEVIEGTGGDGGVVLIFPGQGTQFAGMGRHLHASQPAFRTALDEVAGILTDQGREDIRPLILGEDDAALRPTQVTQLALFAVGYATARWLADGGITPRALLGHSIGEYVAATIAGVFALPDALRLVGARGDLIAALPEAGMLAVSAPETAVRPHLDDTLSLAVVNAPDRVVVAGTDDALDRLGAVARQQGWESRRLPVSHGFHSHLLDPVLDDFAALLAEVPMQPAGLPVFSNETGELADARAMATPGYWLGHLRRTVRFGDNLKAARAQFDRAQMVLAGPGTLRGCLPLMGTRDSQEADCAAALATLWCDGQPVLPLFPGAKAPFRRVPLPGYPFARDVHLLAPVSAASPVPNLDCRTYVPRWTRLPDIAPAIAAEDTCDDLLWLGCEPPAPRPGQRVIHVRPGPAFAQDARGFTMASGSAEDAGRLRAALGAAAPRRIVVQCGPDQHCFGGDTLTALARAFLAGRAGYTLVLITRSMAPIIADEARDPDQALALGLLRALPFETPDLAALWLDADRPPDSTTLARAIALRDGDPGLQPLALGLRNGHLWQRDLAPADLPAAGREQVLRPGRAYVVAGGLGALGRRLARQIAAAGALPVLIGRGIDDDLIAAPGRDPDLARCLADGPSLRLVRAAVEDRAAMDDLAAALDREGWRVGGVFNLAGRYASQLIADLAPGMPGPNHTAKVRGTDVLARAFAAHEPAFVAVFSSMAAEVSGYAYSDYIAANLHAGARAEAEGPAGMLRAIAWDHWDPDDGATLPDGLTPIAVDRGMALLWQVLASGLPYVAVTPMDPARRLQQASDAGRARLAAPQAPTNAPAADAPEDPAQPPLLRLARLLFADVLGLATIAGTDDFLRLGGDSITAVRLVSRLSKVTGQDIALADFMQARTPKALADILATRDGAVARARAYLDLRALPRDQRAALRAAPRTPGETEDA